MRLVWVLLLVLLCGSVYAQDVDVLDELGVISARLEGKLSELERVEQELRGIELRRRVAELEYWVEVYRGNNFGNFVGGYMYYDKLMIDGGN